MKKEIITINGFPGSGKSSTANLVAKTLGFERFSSGDFMRKIAVDMGLTINELNIKAETDENIDIEIDNEVRKAGELNQIVIDSRMAFHWIPESFKVYLELPQEIAKERILNSLKTNKLRQDSEHANTEEEVYTKILERLKSENKRYMSLYNVDNTKRENYNLVVNTNKNNLQEVVFMIVTEYKNWLKN
ncbi:MAG: AAA family ATPase [Candidatus Nomurabacteria bacterium]|nr:AAA family ATPase [Candidatus Nomurabacteria bacterium]